MAAGLRLLQVLAPERAQRLTVPITLPLLVFTWTRILTLRCGEDVTTDLPSEKMTPDGCLAIYAISVGKILSIEDRPVLKFLLT